MPVRLRHWAAFTLAQAGGETSFTDAIETANLRLPDYYVSCGLSQLKFNGRVFHQAAGAADGSGSSVVTLKPRTTTRSHKLSGHSDSE